MARSYGQLNATCPPNRKYHSKGLCTSCCSTKWLKEHPTAQARVRVQGQKRYHANPKVRDAIYKRKYGISLNDYNQILLKQSGGCAICKTQPKNHRLSIDHNHRTKKVRGLVCKYCNQALGILENTKLLPLWQIY